MEKDIREAIAKSGKNTHEWLREAVSAKLKKEGLKCTCHERDGSYACPYCYAKGERGHMQEDKEAE
jgi:hypothetical protein